MSATLVAKDLAGGHAHRTLFEHLDLTVAPGDVVGVVGANGAGKSTLLRLLAGEDLPLGGTVTTAPSDAFVGWLPQEHERVPGETVADHIGRRTGATAATVAMEEAAAGLGGDDPKADEAYAVALDHWLVSGAPDLDDRIPPMLAELGLDVGPDALMTSLSGGQAARAALAALLLSRFDLVLLDEPSNDLDLAGLDRLEAFVHGQRGGVVLVSHDRALLREVGEEFLDLDPSEDGRPRTYAGGYQGWQEGRRRDRERWEQDYAAQQEEHRRLQDSVSAARDRLSTGWRPPKGTGKHQRQTRAPGLVRSFNRDLAALEAHRISVPEPPMSLRFPELSSDAVSTLLRCEGVRVPGRLSGPVSFALDGGERLVVTGPNGAGKSTLLQVLGGVLPPSEGSVWTASGARVALVGQEEPEWTPGLTAADVYFQHCGHLVAAGVVAEREIPSLRSTGLVDAEARRTPAARLSQGQQRRLELALRLASLPQLLILDEPTNHLSAGLVDELTAALRATPAAVVVATHDRQMLDDLADWPTLALGK